MRRHGCGENRTSRRGESPIYEPGLGVVATTSVPAGCPLRRISAAVASSDAFSSPWARQPPGDGHADLLCAAAAQVAEALDGYTVVVTKSTVPVGTGNDVERIIRETRPDADYDVVSNPNSCARAPQSRTSCVQTGS